jgi:ATP-binding cassette subfamily A (ABC1) protein 3
MEEAEALCPKMGIMVDGKFQCFGSAQHIKDKYADGFDIDLKIKDLTEDQIAKYI